MVAWAAGLIAFTAVFLTDAQTVENSRWLLRALFLTYAVSVFSGSYVLSRTIGFLVDRSAEAIAAKEAGSIPPRLNRAARIQFLTFFLAMAMSLWLGLAKTFGSSPSVAELLL